MVKCIVSEMTISASAQLLKNTVLLQDYFFPLKEISSVLRKSSHTKHPCDSLSSGIWYTIHRWVSHFYLIEIQLT